jgi:hypothetical protein
MDAYLSLSAAKSVGVTRAFCPLTDLQSFAHRAPANESSRTLRRSKVAVSGE